MSRTVDVDTFLDGLKLTPLHIRIVVIATLMMMIDGFDLQVLGWVLPKVADDFGVARTALTPALMSQQVGMLIGAYVVAPIGDRYGRRTLLLLCIACVVVSSFATIFANSVVTLAACRLVTGIFASAMIATLVALASEAAPKRMRATIVTIVLAGSMPGAILGSLMQAFLLEPIGWRGAFWIATLLPALMLPIVYFGLPESLRFLAGKDPTGARTRELARRMQPPGAEDVTIAPKEAMADSKATGLRSGPLSAGMAATTALLWLSFICSFLYISGAVWKTTVFRDVIGLPWTEVALTTAIGTATGAVGMLAIGPCIDRFGFRAVVPIFFVIAAAFTVMAGVWAPGIGMFVAVGIMGAFQHGAQAGLASLASAIYPTSMRSTGVGWAYGAGRAASIFGPLLGAAALHEEMGAVGIFGMLAIPLALAGLCVFILTSRPQAPSHAPTAARGHA